MASPPAGSERGGLDRHKGAVRDNRPAWMTKGCGVGVEMFGEHKGDLVKPGLTQAMVDDIESRKGQPVEGPDPFGDFFASRDDKVATAPSPGLVRKPLPSQSLPTMKPGLMKVPGLVIKPGLVVKRPSPPRKTGPKVEGPKEPVFTRLGEETFDGTVGTSVDLDHAPEMNPSGSFSVDFVARLASGGQGYRSPLTSRDMPPPRGYAFFVTPKGKWAFWVGVPEAQAWLKVEGPDAKENEWQRVTGVFDSDERVIKIFVDGQPSTPMRVSTLEPPMLKDVFGANAKRPLRLGAGSTEQPSEKAKFPFPGSVRDIRIYARALSAPLPEEDGGAEPADKKQKTA